MFISHFCQRTIVTYSAAAFVAIASGSLLAAEQGPVWKVPAPAHVTLTVGEHGIARIASNKERTEFKLESVQTLPAKAGDSFQIKIRLKADSSTRAYPELVCYDGEGREIPVASSLGRENPYVTTEWQSIERVYVAQPRTFSVRVRLRGWTGARKGVLLVGKLEFGSKTVDPYQTGALITQPHAYRRQGIVLESNFGVINHDLVSAEDRDGDGKWALVTIDLDKVTAPERRGEDWRSGFEDNPNAILWSDGAVLKSDTVHADRVPNRNSALHFRMQVYPGPYTARISDPGRAVAVSLDGKTWKRWAGGAEISLGKLTANDGIVEFWIDACYRDPISVGPAYFDYVRLSPANDAASVDRLFKAARAKPPQIERGAADEQQVSVTLNVADLSGASIWPARCGLPIPRGDLLSANAIAVLDSHGRKIPTQNRVTATWPDGSAQWVFIDFMHRPNVGPDDGKYTVIYGNRVSAASLPRTVEMKRTSEGIVVDTGAISFVVSGSRFGLIENVRLASGGSVQTEPIVAEIVESEGRIWRASDAPVAKLEIEQAGPLHAVILVETKLAESGKPSEGFHHRARIHAYADSPLIEIDYFVANTDSRPAGDVGGSMSSKVVVKSIGLKLRPTAAITAVAHSLGSASPSGAIVQKSEEETVVRNGDASAAQRTRIDGWLTVRGVDDIAVQVGVSHFREQFPKAFRWSPDEVSIDLWAEEGGDYDWIEGVGKTHHLALLYGAAGAESARVLPRMPLLALAEPDWYTRSGAMGRIEVATPTFMPEVEKTLVRHMKESVVGRVGLGFENFGDHSSGGYVKGTFLWDNNEYDLPAACMVHFARTGDREALEIGLAGALHYLDVDTIHYSSRHADWARAAHVHSHAEFGHHTAEGPNFHHAGYVRGLIWYSYLMGDPAGILGAQGIADWCLRNLGDHTSRHERVLGHPLMTLNDVYLATGEERYLRGSAHLVDQALKWENIPRSGLPAPKAESPAYYSGNPFNAGMTFAALMQFNERANLPEVDRLLQRLAQWVLTDVWRPGGLQAKGGSPRQQGAAFHVGNHGRLMAYAYERTQDPLFLVVPKLLTTSGYGGETRSAFGTRSTGLIYNYLPWLLASLKNNGDPRPGPGLVIECPAEATIVRGATSRIDFRVRNAGATPIADLRASFKTRLDFAVESVTPVPAILQPGETVSVSYILKAPKQINLTCEYNHTAFAHWSALYRRGKDAHLAHRPVTFKILPSPSAGESKIISAEPEPASQR